MRIEIRTPGDTPVIYEGPVDQVLIDGEEVTAKLDSLLSELNSVPQEPDNSLPFTKVQVRAKDGGVYCQVNTKPQRRSFMLEDACPDRLVPPSCVETDILTELSMAGVGNNFYAPAFTHEGEVFLMDGDCVGDLPDDWDNNNSNLR